MLRQGMLIVRGESEIPEEVPLDLVNPLLERNVWLKVRIQLVLFRTHTRNVKARAAQEVREGTTLGRGRVLVRGIHIAFDETAGDEHGIQCGIGFCGLEACSFRGALDAYACD